MVRHLAGFGQRAVTFQVIGNAGRTHGVVADAGFDARPLRVALYQPVGVLLRHPVRRACRAPRGAEQRPVLVARDAPRRDVLIQIRFQLGNARRFMFFAALFMEAAPIRAAPG